MTDQTSAPVQQDMNRFANSAAILRQFAARSTIHGLLHIFQSDSRTRQVFWTVLLLAAVLVGTWHTVITVQKFVKNPVASVLQLSSEEAVFPDITICNLKPATDILAGYIDYYYYIEKNWQFFDNWEIEGRKRRKNESDLNFENRLLSVFERFFRIMWASADLRDMGHSDVTMLLSCKYNGESCEPNVLHLVQTHRFWNCYTFNSSYMSHVSRIGNRGEELEIVAFTESYETSHLEKLKGKCKSIFDYNRNSSAAADQNSTVSSVPVSLSEYYVCVPCINKILSHGNLESAGLRVFIHEPQNYPLFSKDVLNVQPGRSSTITLRPMRSSLKSESTRRCSRPPHEKVKYIKYFAAHLQEHHAQEYDKTEMDFVAEAKQKFVFDHCGCYSHRYPFQVNTSELCYHVPPEHWVSPSEAAVRNIACHDRWVNEFKSEAGHVMQQFQERKSCEFVRYRPSLQSIKWPRFEDVEDIWEDLFVPHIQDGVEFQPSDGRKHHIMKVDNDTHSPLFTRQRLLFFPLFFETPKCKKSLCTAKAAEKNGSDCNFTHLEKHFQNAAPCIERKYLANNLVRLRLKLLSPMSDVYTESYSYHWTEALSEIGSIFGVYLGASLLVTCELVELVYLLVRNCLRNRPTPVHTEN